jgi:hypothetical protein
MPSGILEFPWSIALSNNFTDRFWVYAEQGLLDFSENIIVAPEPNPTFNIKIMHRTILGDTVIFSYPLRKYRGTDGVASNITINSSAKCKRRPVHAIGHDTSVSLPTIVGTCTYTWLDCLLTIYIVNATYPQLEEESLAFLYSAFQSSEVLLKHHVAGSVRTASDQVLRNKCSSTCVYIHLLQSWDSF